MSSEVATLGGGCFWCIEAVFLELEGVSKVTSGYSGGAVENPSYRQVCSATTGHAEVVQVEFDPEVLAYRKLLEVFLAVHDPTTRDRQGGDVGPQYRSIILWHSDEQQQTAEQTIRDLDAAGIWSEPIVTEVARFEKFWPAESEHHDYYRQNPAQPYCRVVIDPKVAKFRQHFDALRKR